MPKPRFSAAACRCAARRARSAAGQRQQAGDAVERRGLAAAGRPEQRDELAAPDRQRQLVERGDARAARLAEVPRDAVEPQLAEVVLHRHARRTASRSPRRRSASAVMRALPTSSSARRPAGPRGGTPRPSPWLERRACGNFGDPLVVFGPAELLDRVLALLRRHRQRHVLHRRARIEIALVVGQRLLLRLEHELHQVEHTRASRPARPSGRTM